MLALAAPRQRPSALNSMQSTTYLSLTRFVQRRACQWIFFFNLAAAGLAAGRRVFADLCSDHSIGLHLCHQAIDITYHVVGTGATACATACAVQAMHRGVTTSNSTQAPTRRGVHPLALRILR